MNKKRYFGNFIWILAAAFSRIFYYTIRRGLFGTVNFPGLSPKTVTDTYGYFEYAMVRIGEERPALGAGLSAGYAGHLSWLLKFIGNRLEAVSLYQLILQILWLVLFFAGMTLLFGYLAGIAAG
ncbi:MAG: hypothetical protein NC400_12740, partial [Clostridium sp.]|nr:hypothetical protein [Clostridium sp.]